MKEGETPPDRLCHSQASEGPPDVELEPEVEQAIREAAMGNREEESELRKTAKQCPLVREFFKNPSAFGLTSVGPDSGAAESPQDK